MFNPYSAGRHLIRSIESTNVSIPSPRKAFDSMLDDAHFPREDAVIAAIGDKGNGPGLVEATSYTQNKGETLGRALTHHTSKAEARNVGMAHEAVSLGSLTQIDRLEQPKSGADMRDAVVGGATGSSRPTRRQRAIVSYAEPNLRDKMRRPTNELVAAVGDRTRRTSSTIDILMSTGEDGDAYRRRKSDTVKSQVLGTTGTDSPSPVLNPAMASPSKSMKMVSQRKRKVSLASRYDHATTRETAEGSCECPDYPLTDLGNQEHEPEGQYTAALSIKNSSDEGLSTRLTEATCHAKTISRAHKPQPATARQSKRRSSSLKASEQDTLKPDEAVQDSRDITPSLFKVLPIKVNERLEQPDHDRRASAEIFQISSTTSVSTETKQAGRSLRAAARRSMML